MMVRKRWLQSTLSWEQMVPQHPKCSKFWSLLWKVGRLKRSQLLSKMASSTASWGFFGTPDVPGSGPYYREVNWSTSYVYCKFRIYVTKIHQVLDASDQNEWSSSMIVTIDITNYWSFQNLGETNFFMVFSMFGPTTGPSSKNTHTKNTIPIYWSMACDSVVFGTFCHDAWRVLGVSRSRFPVGRSSWQLQSVEHALHMLEPHNFPHPQAPRLEQLAT